MLPDFDKKIFGFVNTKSARFRFVLIRGLLGRLVSSDSFLAGGVLECNLSRNRSVCNLHILYNVRSTLFQESKYCRLSILFVYESLQHLTCVGGTVF